MAGVFILDCNKVGRLKFFFFFFSFNLGKLFLLSRMETIVSSVSERESEDEFRVFRAMHLPPHPFLKNDICWCCVVSLIFFFTFQGVSYHRIMARQQRKKNQHAPIPTVPA